MKAEVRFFALFAPLIAVLLFVWAVATVALEERSALKALQTMAINNTMDASRTTGQAALLFALHTSAYDELNNSVALADRQLAALDFVGYDIREDITALWELMRTSIENVVAYNAEVSAQSMICADLLMPLKRTTDDVAEMMNNRTLPIEMVKQARRQLELVNQISLLSAVYVANGDLAAYGELMDSIDEYARTLTAFANTEITIHGAILALVADNQLAWRDYHEAIIKTVSARKAISAEINTIVRYGAQLDALFYASAAEISNENSQMITVLRLVRNVFALLFAVLLGYSVTVALRLRKKPPRSRVFDTTGSATLDTIDAQITKKD